MTLRITSSLLISLTLSLIPTISYGAVSQGQACKSLNKVTIVSQYKYTCLKKGKKLIWVKEAKASSLPKKTVTPVQASKPTEAPQEVVIPDPKLTDRANFAQVKECKIEAANPNGDLYTGFPKNNKFVPNFGNRKALVLFVDFSDLNADQRAIAEWKNNQIPFAEKVFMEMSYGKYNLKYELVEKFYRLPVKWEAIVKNEAGNIPGSTPALAMNHQTLISETVKAADLEVDFSQYDFLNIVTPPAKPKVEGGASGGGGFSVDGRTTFLAISGPLDEYLDDKLKLNWLAHETGHLLGLTHIYNFQQRQGAWDLMGNVFAHDDILGWNKFFMSWIEDSQVNCIEKLPIGESVHFLTPVGTKDAGIKLVIVKLSANEAILIESRRKSALDAVPPADEGVLIYKVDTRIPDGRGTVTLFANPVRMSKDKRGSEVVLGIIKEGEVAEFQGYTIKVLKRVSAGDFVSVRKN